jgi:hypothetical protein
MQAHESAVSVLAVTGLCTAIWLLSSTLFRKAARSPIGAP